MSISEKAFFSSQIQAAAGVWEEIKNSPVPADRWLGNYFHRFRKKFGSRDRRFISETVYSLFRHKSFLEFWDHEAGGFPPESTTLMAAAMAGLIDAENFQKQIPDFKNAAVFYEKLLRNELPKAVSQSLKATEEKVAANFSFPLWLVQRWTATFGEEECRSLLRSFQERPPLTVRTNVLKIKRDQLLKRFQSLGFEVGPTPYAQNGIIFRERANLFDGEEFGKGLFEIQDEGSQLICQKIGPKPGMVVWDVCAGGGGKSLSLAAFMQNKGRVIATDIRIKKLEDLKKRAKRAGAYNIFPADLNRLQESRELKKGADIILIDAPCSGTGTFRRNPDAKWKIGEADFERLHAQQLDIIEKALPYLAPQGKLYYATCSIEPVENEKVMEEVLARHPELQLGVMGENGEAFLKLYPHRHSTDGFFLAMAENRKEIGFINH